MVLRTLAVPSRHRSAADAERRPARREGTRPAMRVPGPGRAVPDPVDAALPDIDWAAIGPDLRRCSLRVPSGRLAGLASGAVGSPRVVLAPGITGSKEDFRLLLPAFAAAGYLAEAYDAAGQYESTAAGPENLGAARRWDYDLFVDDLIAVIEQASSPVHLLGHSFQAVVAQLVAVRRPELVASLTLLSPPPLVGDALRWTRPVGAVSPVLPASVVAGIVRWSIRHNVQHVPPGRQRFVESRFALTRVDAHVASIGLLRHVPDVRAAVRLTGLPVLVAVGEGDVWSVGLHERYAGDLGAALRVYPGGHSPCESAPHALGRDMLALFESARGPR